jgi:RNA polymerase sigma-70 factor (ECF subfamily)
MTPDEFRRLAELHRASVFRAARRVLGHDEDALDVTQETLLELARHQDAISGAGMRAWLVRVATHRAIDRLRRRGPIQAAAPLERAAPAGFARPDALEGEELRERVRRALTTLPARQAEIVALRFFEEMRFTEAAEAMGISEGAAKVHFRRAIERLRELLAPLRPVPTSEPPVPRRLHE